ncbi:MAG: Single-stranded DNA binding protein [Halobacteriaceae archaeon]
MTLEDHAEELASDLGVDKAEVQRDLENLVEYSVPVEEAKQSLRRKYGSGSDDGGSAGQPEPVDIADLQPDDGNVTVTAVVLTVGKRPIRYRGEDHVILEGELADETGTVAYTAWEDFDLAPGDTVTISNASVREWEGAAELNFGESATVTTTATSLDIDAAVGGDRALTELAPGDRGVNLDVQVAEVEEKTISGRDGDTEILSGVLADASARLPFTDWEPRPAIVEGADLRIENAYVREFRGVPAVNLSEFSSVTPLEEPVDAGGPTEYGIGEALTNGGAYDVALTGNVIEIRDGSGLVERCPECGRVTDNGTCRTHGDVDGEDDLRVKAVLDDGTGAVTAILDRELTETIYGGGLAAARDAARDAMDTAVVAETIRDELLGREYRAVGHLSVDEYGANLEVTAFEPADDDPADRARALLEALEVAP